HVDDVVLALDVLGIDVGVNVAAAAVQLIEGVEAALNRLAPDRLALLQRPVADDLLACEDGVAADRDLAEGVNDAFLGRDDDPDALFPASADFADLRIAERDVLVAVVLVEVLDLLQVLIELRGDVEVLLADPGDDVGRLHFLHQPAEAAIGETPVADEVHLGDGGLLSFIDVEDDLL